MGVSDRGGVIFFFLVQGSHSLGKKKLLSSLSERALMPAPYLSLMPAPGSVPSS